MTRVLLAFVIVISTACASKEEVPDHFVIENLTKGAYSVGFKSIWKLDTTRDYPLILNDSTIVSNQKRPVLFNIWYPVTRAGTEPMNYEEYFKIEDSSADFSAFSNSLKDYNLNVLADELFGQEIKALDSINLRALDFLLKTKTAAYRNISFPATGKFPLVIYHSGAGSSYDDNSVLCEFLASHGYVVVGSAFQKANGSTLSVDAGEGSFNDIDFLIRESGKLGFIDTTVTALMGHSLGAQTLLKYQSMGLSRAKSIVLLDATFEYHSVNNDLFWSQVISQSKQNKDQFNNRILGVSIYESFYQLYETFEMADRYYLSMDYLSHNEFISQGVLRKKLIKKFGSDTLDSFKSYPSVSERYAFVCNTVLNFLSESDLNEIRPASSGRSFEISLKTNHSLWQSEHSGPPTPRQHFALYKSLGVDSALSVLKNYESLADTNPLYKPDYGFGWVFDLLSHNQVAEARKVNAYFDLFEPNGIQEVFNRNKRIGERYGVDLIINYFEDKRKLLD